MNDNKLIIAAAGSGKTTYLVKKASEIDSGTVLITTYTEANEAEIRKKIINRKGCIPSNITIQTWFSFLLQHGVRPYQSLLSDDVHDENIGFLLTSRKSGQKTDKKGKPVRYNDRPIYWGAGDFKKYYFTKSMKIYSDKISKFVFESNKASKNLVINRITRIFDYIFIDEIQDLAGFDLEMIKLFFMSSSVTMLVGDPRQVTYLTNHTTKFKKYSDGKIKDFVLNELGKKIDCEIDETTLSPSHRNNQAICNYSAKLYPALTTPKPCTCNKCRENITNHEGVFIIQPSGVGKYLSKYNPMQLRWSTSTKCSTEYQAMNFGESKGLSFPRVLIYPTEEMKKWIKDDNHKLKSGTRAKLYVAITRARNSTTVIMDFDNDDIFEGAEKYFFKI